MKKSLTRNAALNAIKYLCKIALPLITFPYVTRILQPELYGKINYCASIIGFFQIFAALGINEYATREGVAYLGNKEKLNKFAGDIFTLNLLSTIITYILLIVFLLIWKVDFSYKVILLIQSASIFATTIGVEWIFTVHEDYFYITVRSIIVQIISIVAIYLFVKTKEDYLIYTVISVGSVCLGHMIGFVYSFKYVKITIQGCSNLKEHLKPVLILFFNIALISVYINSDKAMLGALIGDTAVGLYEVSTKIYTMVKAVINAVVLVALPRLSLYLRNGDNDTYSRLAKKIFDAQILILFPALIGLFMTSREIVFIIAGESYINAVTSLKILSFALLFAVLANFFVYVLMISLRMDSQILKLTILSAVINVGLNCILIPNGGINAAAATTLIAEATASIMGYLFCRRSFKFNFDIRSMVSTLVGCLLIVLTCCVIELFGMPVWISFVLKVAMSVILYGLVQLILNKMFLLEIKNYSE